MIVSCDSAVQLRHGIARWLQPDPGVPTKACPLGWLGWPINILASLDVGCLHGPVPDSLA